MKRLLPLVLLLVACAPRIEPNGPTSVTIWFRGDWGDGSNLANATVEANRYCARNGWTAHLVDTDLQIAHFAYRFTCR